MYRRSIPQAIEKMLKHWETMRVLGLLPAEKTPINMNCSSGVFLNMDVTDACFLYLIDILQAWTAAGCTFHGKIFMF